MKSLFGRMLSLAGVAAAVASSQTRAQDFFRDFGTSRSSGGLGPVRASEYVYRDIIPSGFYSTAASDTRNPAVTNTAGEDTEEYNFAIGPVRFSLAAGLGLEFNDNITLSDKNRESDFIIRPSLNLDARWKLSELNTLRFSVGVSYAKYVDHSEFDTQGILLSPTSELVLNLEIGSLKVTARDRMSYQEEPYDIPQLSGVAVYRRMENQAGVQVAWPMTQSLTLTVGYDHYNLWTFDDQFSSEERSIDTVFVRPTVQVAPGLKLGVNAAWSFIDFTSDERQDGDSLLVGPLIEWQFSEVTSFYLEVGYQRLNFDGTSTFDNEFLQGLSNEERALFRDSSSTNSYYVKLEIENKPTPGFEHRLLGSKTAEIGFGSNYYDLYHVEYDAHWKFMEHMDFGPSLFWEYYEASGDGGEKAWRVGAALGFRYNFSNSLTLGLDYRFLMKDSNLKDADYYQNLAFLSLYYKF